MVFLFFPIFPIFPFSIFYVCFIYICFIFVLSLCVMFIWANGYAWHETQIAIGYVSWIVLYGRHTDFTYVFMVFWCGLFTTSALVRLVQLSEPSSAACAAAYILLIPTTACDWFSGSVTCPR